MGGGLYPSPPPPNLLRPRCEAAKREVAVGLLGVWCPGMYLKGGGGGWLGPPSSQGPMGPRRRQAKNF